MAEPTRKSDQAFRTIGELANELGVPQHILRYWETRFPQLKPLQRAGNRRYYRTADVALAHRIHRLLNADGYTIRGVQQLLAGGAADDAPTPSPATPTASAAAAGPAFPAQELRALRETLRAALDG
ncbi:MerR family transcriptional regulator [Allosphingosinicella indica]|uniref:DNA-binding transcriptional regulator, MerR family n=1 Tax=Allosphingosinicella indica TaxID=941907 RepID=A0A1X7GIQ3_9SPHN|nr:MerR family transcriptional regulator [Allosphingosinicella indica]SMF70435.1 DNA-binding transcriptional regulator, MerR family [Allosphingosinicella indica]